MFILFPNTLPDVIFGGPKHRSITKSGFFHGFWDPAGSQNGPLEHHFRPKRRQKGYPANGTKRPGADLGAIWRRKRSKDVFLSIWGRWKGFGPIWNDFSMIFRRF